MRCRELLTCDSVSGREPSGLCFCCGEPYARFIPRSALAGLHFITAARLIDWKPLGYAIRASTYDAGLQFSSGYLPRNASRAGATTIMSAPASGNRSVSMLYFLTRNPMIRSLMPSWSAALAMLPRVVLSASTIISCSRASHRAFERPGGWFVELIRGLQGRGKVVRLEGVAAAQQDGALDAVLQFAHVAGPVVTHH